jgi:hypothetical protein
MDIETGLLLARGWLEGRGMNAHGLAEQYIRLHKAYERAISERLAYRSVAAERHCSVVMAMGSCYIPPGMDEAFDDVDEMANQVIDNTKGGQP